MFKFNINSNYLQKDDMRFINLDNDECVDACSAGEVVIKVQDSDNADAYKCASACTTTDGSEY